MTLLEALLAAAVLAMAATAIIMPFSAGAAASAQEARSTLAVSVAQDLMEEILSQPFSDANGEAGETGRTNWDDMLDYRAYVEAPGALRCRDGSFITDAASTGMGRIATVEAFDPDGAGPCTAAEFLRVTVRINYRGQDILALSRIVYKNQ